SYLSLEQQWRRATDSSLPHEFYELAVLRHTLTDPETGQAIPCRVLFFYSSADEAICRQTRERDLLRLRQGLAAIAATVARRAPPPPRPRPVRRGGAPPVRQPCRGPVLPRGDGPPAAPGASRPAAAGPGLPPAHAPLPL